MLLLSPPPAVRPLVSPALVLFVCGAALPGSALAAPAPTQEREYGGVTEVVSLPTLADDASVADELAALRARVDELEAREREREQQPQPVKPETSVVGVTMGGPV